MEQQTAVTMVPIEEAAMVSQPAEQADVRGVPLSEVVKMIDRLPEGYGQVFRLSVFEGMSHKEIADMLGIEPHSSSSQLARAKKMLRKMMQHYWVAMLLLLFIPVTLFLLRKGDNAVTNDETRYPVLKIGAYAFNNCTELTSVNMPASINEIGDHAFENCSALSNVTIPYAVTLIGPSAFKDCASITQINIPARVTKVKIWAFENCTSLTDVYCHIADPNAINSLAFSLESENYANRTLHVPAGCVDSYKEAGWNEYFGNIVEM
jgi:cbb3-type cytochrome oxidase subunit 3